MPAPISVQLYSLREEASKDFRAVIARLGEIGYAGVEPAGFHDLSPKEFRQAVEAAGLEVSAAHAPLPLGDDASKLLDAQEEIGTRAYVVPFAAPDRFETEDGVKGVADELNGALEAVNGRGMTLGYHNHFWEFSNQFGGRTAHEHLFDLLDPEIFAEVDVYWARVGGVDPAELVRALGPRARLLHVKDGPADGPRSAMTAVGDGTLDIPGILGANTSVEWHIVELDRCDGDMFEAIERSHRYLVSNGLSRGRA